MEWGQLPQNKNCKNFLQWVEHFYTGGYVPLDSGKKTPDRRKPSYFADNLPDSQHVESELHRARQTLGHCVGPGLSPLICENCCDN